MTNVTQKTKTKKKDSFGVILEFTPPIQQKQ